MNHRAYGQSMIVLEETLSWQRGLRMSISVVSLRKIKDRAYYEVVFEWENTFAQYFRSELIQMLPVEYYGRKMYCKLSDNYRLRQNINSNCSVLFVMSPNEMCSGVLKSVIPVFMDVWTDEQIDIVVDKTSALNLFYCTSIEVYQRIKAKESSSRVKYMPLSVSDIYFSKEFSRYSKSIDVIQVGRRNQVLHDFMMQYTAEHPDVEYVFTNGIRHGELIDYVSTKRGNIGTIVGRGEFIRWLSSAKVSLVSTPAIDGSREHANGIDFLTPRFYESAVFGCAMIGRYGANEETKRLQGICPNVETYEQFSKEMDKALAIRADELYQRTEGFITSNLTTCRARQIEADLNELRHSGIGT